MPQLTTTDHSRDSAGLTYIYPVISRRAGGLSIGINFNPNNACNWRCIYCQVPHLTRGAAPKINLRLLEDELNLLLVSSQDETFYEHYLLPTDRRIIRDIAISGNGEPTSCREFASVIEIIGGVLAKFESLRSVKRILITNGSLIARPQIQQGLDQWSQLGGQVWFKLDRATEAGIRMINNTDISLATVRRHLEICARLCPTWIQTCLFAVDGLVPSEEEQQAYVQFLAELQQRNIFVKGVLLYGLARPSMQMETLRLSAVTREWLAMMGRRLQEIGLVVTISE